MGPSDAAGEEASVSGSGLRPLAGRVRRRDGAPGQGGSLAEEQAVTAAAGREGNCGLNVLFLCGNRCFSFSASSHKTAKCPVLEKWNCGFDVFQEEGKIKRINVESRVRKDRESL